MSEAQQDQTATKAADDAAAQPEPAAENSPEGGAAAGPGAPAEAENVPAGVWVRHRKMFLAGGSGLISAAVVGTVLALVLPGEDPAPPPYSVGVTYKVTGEGKATITYNTGRPGEPGGRAQLVELPWTKKVQVQPASGAARVSIVLDEDGGRAQCAVSVDGQHRQRATAFGDFGRASCSAQVPEEGDHTH